MDGDNDFRFGAIELDNVPYGRLFRALAEPRYGGTTPVIAAMADKDLRLPGADVCPRGPWRDGLRRCPGERHSRDLDLRLAA